MYAAIAGKLSKIPVICSEHGDIHHISKRRFIGVKARIISLLAKKIISVSYYTRDELLLSGVDPRKIIVLSNPLDFSLPAKTIREQSRWQIRKTLNISNESWVWINVANLRPVKDQKTLLRGFAESRTLISREQHLIIAGDGELRKDLEKEAERLEISELVHFLGFRNDIPELLMSCDGFILSSLSEAMPLSLIEAAKYKLLLIGTYVGGIPEVIIDNESGFLFEPRNSDDLSEKMMLALTLGDVSNNMREKAHIENMNKSSSEVVINKLVEIYQEALI
jgi:glycosyltransferase involved in cell wall biosynthesis